MADTSQIETSTPARSVRSVLHSAYTFVRSMEANQASAATTLDHLIDEQISSLKAGQARALVDGRGNTAGSRLSRWDRLDRLEKDIIAVVDTVAEAGDDDELLWQLGIYESAEGRT